MWPGWHCLLLFHSAPSSQAESAQGCDIRTLWALSPQQMNTFSSVGGVFSSWWEVMAWGSTSVKVLMSPTELPHVCNPGGWEEKKNLYGILEAKGDFRKSLR